MADPEAPAEAASPGGGAWAAPMVLTPEESVNSTDTAAAIDRECFFFRLDRKPLLLSV